VHAELADAVRLTVSGPFGVGCHKLKIRCQPVRLGNAQTGSQTSGAFTSAVCGLRPPIRKTPHRLRLGQLLRTGMHR